MRGDGGRWAAALGGAALVLSLWAPWFERRLSSVLVAPVPGARTAGVSGWAALGGSLGAFALVTGIAGVAWALWRRRASGAWLVVPGALALLAVMAVTVSRVGVENVVTTTPVAGLALAFGGAAGVVLAGLVALLRR